jgi:hypothetical protein
MVLTAAGMFDNSDELRRLSEQMRSMTEPYRQMQEQMAALSKAYASPMLEMQKTIQAINQSVFEPYRKMQESVRLISLQISAPLRAYQSAMKSLASTITPILNAHRVAQQNVAKQLADAIAPSLEFQKHISNLFSQVARSKNLAFTQAIQTLAEQLQDYNPDVQKTDDGIIIDGETFTQSDIVLSIVQQNVLSNSNAWEALPLKVKWILLQILLPLFLGILGNCVWYQIQQSGLLHHQKQEIRAIKQEVKASATNSVSPFVSQDNLAVYAASKRHSRIITYLPFKTEITILEYRKKKRWLLVEWNVGGQVNRGWVLGRYVFRPSKYRRTN